MIIHFKKIVCLSLNEFKLFIVNLIKNVAVLPLGQIESLMIQRVEPKSSLLSRI